MVSRLILGIMIVLILGSVIFIGWQLIGDNGRLGRDLANWFSGADYLPDDEVKSIWCLTRDFERPYRFVDGVHYCNVTPVNIECVFTNKGDNCVITELGEEAN